eukprot:Gb_32581 [translate_table: standard]
MKSLSLEYNWYYGCLLNFKQTPFVAHEFILSDGDDNQHYSVEMSTLTAELCREEANVILPCKSSVSVTDDFEIENGKEENEGFGRMFKVLDEDGNGKLSTEEIVRVLQRLGLEMPKKEVELAVRAVSASGDDYLTLMEFEDFYETILCQEEEEMSIIDDDAHEIICEVFRVFDQNGDGLISAMELADVLCRLGFVEGRDLHCCERMIQSVDYNGDSYVDLHEFINLMMRNSSSSSFTASSSS